MEKTIAPIGHDAPSVQSVSETVGPQQGLTHRDVLNDPKNDRLLPSFYIYEKNRVTLVQIPEDENIFKIGHGKDCDIVLADNMISDVQVTVVRMGDHCFFMDCGTKDRTTFNGVKKRQEIVPAESRMVMKIGNTWLVYLGLDARKYDDTDSVILKRSLLTNRGTHSEAEILLQSSFGEWYSDTAPILVGSHNACDYRIAGQNVQPFHFIIYFSPTGAFIEDLTHGQPGIKVDGLNCIGARPIKGDLSISIDKLSIYLYLYGDPMERAATLFRDSQEMPDLALTQLKKDKARPIGLPKTNEKLSIGRSSECNIIIPNDPSISRIHAYMIIRDKCLFIEDNKSHNKTFVNLKPISKASVLPGDILEFGDSSYLVHYQY